MVQLTTIFIALFVQYNLIYTVECDDKRIIIYVPQRVKMVHHHHHHVVLMDPKKKTITHAKPYMDKSLAEDFRNSVHGQDSQKQYANHLLHHQHQQLQQPIGGGGYPVSYLNRRKTMGTGYTDSESNAILYPYSQLPTMNVVGFTEWPIRNKRSRLIARMYTSR